MLAAYKICELLKYLSCKCQNTFARAHTHAPARTHTCVHVCRYTFIELSSIVTHWIEKFQGISILLRNPRIESAS